MTPPAAKVNPRIQGIRDRTGLGTFPVPEEELKPVVEEVKSKDVDTCGVAEKTLRKTLAAIRFNGLDNVNDIAESTGCGGSTTSRACRVLEEMGCIEGTKTKPKKYTYITTPEGWILEDLPPSKLVNNGKKVFDPTDNILTKLLSKKNPRVLLNSIAQYEQFIRDTSGDYGGELAELVDGLHEFCKSRIMLATEECPLCGRLLGREGTRVYCRNCDRSIDYGDSAKSLDAYLRYARLDKEARP